jgi:hypothetical protein
MALTLDGTNGIVSSGSITTQSATGVIFSDSSSLPAASSPYVLKNRIINGAMVIDQRNAGASVTPANGTYTLDRWGAYQSAASKFTVQQNAGSVTPPAGFKNYLGVTSSSAYSVGSGDYFAIYQIIEGYNVADLDWGTANAKTVTLSFWVRSSLTGTFGGSLQNSANNRSYPFTYTISVANTWEQKTVTVAGDTSGTWLTTNGAGLYVQFGLGVGTNYSGTATGSWVGANYLTATGATSVVGTNGATFYITGVQLEQNTSATPFERRLYGQELVNCQRYFQLASNGVTGVGKGLADIAIAVKHIVEMRTTPSIAQTGVLRISDITTAAATQTATNISIDSSWSNSQGVWVQASNFSPSPGANRPLFLTVGTGNPGLIQLSAEL